MGYIEVIAKICQEIDSLYAYAKTQIPPDKQHRLGYMKEVVKGIVEELITMLCKED